MRVRSVRPLWQTARRTRRTPNSPAPLAQLAERALFDQVSGVLGPVAAQHGGQPTWLVKPELRRVWWDTFGAELGEPTLSWVAQAIQDRQPGPIGWRSPQLVKAAPSAARHPVNWLRASLDLPPSARALDRVPDLLRDLLVGWGPAAAQLVEDAQLVTTALVSSAMDRADPRCCPRLDLTFEGGVLRVCLTIESAADPGRTLPARQRRRTATLLLDSLAPGWQRRGTAGSERTWFELRIRNGR
jgi:hypothetical protein